LSDDEPGCALGFLIAGILWVVIFLTAAFIVARLT
jgi:hypothetical protein